MAKQRMPRVEELIKQEISLIIQKDLMIPTLGFVTVTGARVSKDLRQAQIDVSVYGSEDSQKTSIKELNKSSRTIRNILRKRIRLKNIPYITFTLDETAEYSDQISRQLKIIEEEKKSQQDD